MSGYIGVVPLPQATQTRDVFTATSGQTTFATSGYTPNFLDVWLNGVKLVNGDDFTATNGSDVVLTSGATAGDTVEVLSYSTFEVNSQTYTGGLTVNNDGATVLTVDRATSDGSIIDVKKNGTTVGSIGVGGSNDLTIGDGPAGLIMDGDGATPIIGPWNTSTNSASDASVDLGYASGRFKDLYLSGGVYVGGTGAANYLDDYEEGTYYPELTSSGGSFSSVTYNTQLGNYVIVGDIIHVAGNIGASAISGGSGTLYITLPASCPSGIGGAGGVVGYISGLNYNSPTFNQVGLYISNGGGALLKFTCSGDDTSAIETPISNFTSVFNCTFQVSYRIT